MLLPPKIAAGVADGTVTLAFRRWAGPRVKVGGRFLTSAGLIEVTSVEQIADDAVTQSDAEAAGAPSPAAVLKLTKGGPEVPLFRVGLAWAGPDPRIALRESAELTDDEITDLRTKLTRLDRPAATAPGRSRLSASSSSIPAAALPISPSWSAARRHRSRSMSASSRHSA